MIKRKASAKWEGTLKQGQGKMSFGSYKDITFGFSRFEEGEDGTNPEELVGAALSGCFSMAFNVALERAGFKAEYVKTDATVGFEKTDDGWRITKIFLDTNVKAEGIEEDKFQELANGAKEGCPMSNALDVDIELNAKLE